MIEVVFSALAFFVNLVLGFWVLVNNPKSATNRLFSLLTLVLAAWTVLNYFSLHAETPENTLILIRVILFLAAYKPPLLYLLFKTFPDTNMSISKKILVPIIVFPVIASLVALSPFVFTELKIVNGNPQPVPGIGMPIWAVTFFTILILSFVLLIRRLRSETGNIKVQMKLLLMGFVLSFSFFLFTNFIMVNVFQNTSLVAIGPLFTVILATFIAYAIVKHGLFNIKVITTVVLSLALWVVLLSRLVFFQTASEFLVNLFILFLVLVLGVLLIRSVKNEIDQKEKLLGLTNKLKELDAQKDEFINMAAHELRAPMTAIKGYVTMVMEGDTGDIPEKARGFLADANNINDRLIRLVNNMLNVSRIEEGRLVFQEEVENLSRPVRSVFSQFAPEAERKGLEYHLDIAQHIRDKVKVDPDRIQEVIGNLLSNAVKYTDRGSVEVKLLQPDEKTVRFEVTDTGPGISELEQKRLFKKFERVETNVGKTTGTGLGLYISKLLVEKFNGNIGLKSKPGEGSTFWFELPLVGGNGSASGAGNDEDESYQGNQS